MNARMIVLSGISVLFASLLNLVGATSGFAANTYLVDYRVTQWKTSQFDNVKMADEYYGVVTRLGCQAKNGPRNGRTEVSYICPEWRRIALQNDNEAHQWEEWLKANGFETKHSH